MAKYSLKKKEILSGKKQIAGLFDSGKSLYRYPLKVFFKFTSIYSANHSNVLFGVSVSKKKFRKAHERNLLKRRIRESYRLNKYELLDNIESNTQLYFMFVFIGNKIENYNTINRSLLYLLSKLLNEK
ncbi:MAG: ribonuclease P protein component [Deltaproteobacteria bacterium]